MGFFSFSVSKPTYTDKVWKASSYCLKGMITDALQHITSKEAPVILSHFAESQERIIQFLSTNSVPHLLVEKGNEEEAWNQTQIVYVLDWKLNSSAEAINFIIRLMRKLKTKLLFFGHYPLPSKEKKLLEHLQVIQPTSPITFYSSLDEPSFRIFNSDNIISLMEKLGMKDEEVINHAMVTKAMERAREKIESKVKFEHEAFSEKEWFQKNVSN